MQIYELSWYGPDYRIVRTATEETLSEVMKAFRVHIRGRQNQRIEVVEIKK